MRNPTLDPSGYAEDRFLKQRLNDRDDVELDLKSGSEVILSDDRVLETELELYGSPPDLRHLGDEKSDRYVPFVALAGPVVVGDRRTETDLPGVGQVVEAVNRLGFSDQIEGQFSAVEKLTDRSNSLARMAN